MTNDARFAYNKNVRVLNFLWKGFMMLTFLFGCMVGAGMVIVGMKITEALYTSHHRKHIAGTEEDFFKEEE